MRIKSSAAGEDDSEHLDSSQSEPTDAPMPWAMPSVVAVAVFEDDFLDIAGLEASWDFEFTPNNTTVETAQAVQPWSDIEDDDSDMPAMAPFEESGLETFGVAVTFIPGSEPLMSPGAPTAGSHLFDRFACPLGLHGAHRMCNWACNNAATLRMPAMYLPVMNRWCGQDAMRQNTLRHRDRRTRLFHDYALTTPYYEGTIELYTTAVDSELQKSVAELGVFWTDLGALSKEARANRWPSKSAKMLRAGTAYKLQRSGDGAKRCVS
ncbi:hypothetical protein LTR95_012907 [Oleoguttula sp. CCFEE 5521]